MEDFLSFQIFSSCLGTLEELLNKLEYKLYMWMMEHDFDVSQILQSRIYLSDASNQWTFVQSSSLYREVLCKGAVSYIEQPLLSGAKVAVQVAFSREIPLAKEGTPDNMRIRFNDIVLYFQSVRFGADDVVGLDAKAQTELAFQRHIAEITKYGLTLEHDCHRTWIYVRDIDRHYSGVVEGRNEVFDKQGLTRDTHYIASTGIGGYSDNREAIVGIDFLSFEGVKSEQVKYLHALDHLNPTHEYGVAFERGTQLALPKGAVSFISGTASIDKYGECLHRGDVLTQTGRLFLNIDKLLADGGQTLDNLKYMIVYLRDIADYTEVESYLNLRFPRVPHLVVEARVCRPEWLIEVEAVAIQ